MERITKETLDRAGSIDWYDVWHGRLINTPDGTGEEEEYYLVSE